MMPSDLQQPVLMSVVGVGFDTTSSWIGSRVDAAGTTSR